MSLAWNGVSTASSYNVKRATRTGGPYSQVASVTVANDSDTSLTNGTTYYYVVSAVNAAGESANSTQVSATPIASTNVTATIDVLTNRHAISPYIYGGSYPTDAATITDSGLGLVRWGGNATSTYNWQLQTYNADFDYYFEDFASQGFSNGSDGSSTQFITDVKNAGSAPLMTMVMLPWVAKSAEAAGNGHWSFSVAKYGAQCGVDPYNTDAGNGIVPGTCNSNTPTYLSANPNDAYFPLLDDHTQTCAVGTTCVYRNDWAAALATAFGNGSCPIPYSSITSCHFYDMDNEIDIWGGTHRDIHPNPSGYDELSSTYLTEARNLKIWDPQAVRLGPVSCCWWFYWNGANSNDKGTHAGIDFLPWWLNEIYWQDQISGARSLDVFDIHAYPDGPDTSNYTQAQKRALAVSIYRDYWDPAFVSPSGSINQPYATNIQPNKTIPFRIPRMRAMVNSIYPATPLAVTEWSAAFAGESDFSTALGDADAYGILGRERVSLAARWEAPVASDPNYQTLKLYTNYDGVRHGFGTTSVSATHNANPDLFSIYAALNSAGNTLTIVVLNKDPGNAAQVQLTTTGFTPTAVTTYTVSQNSPSNIVASSSQAWSPMLTFAPYSATLLVVSGNMASAPAAEWDLNPDTVMIPAGGTYTLRPKIVSASGTVTLSTPQFDSGITVAVTQAQVTTTQSGAVAVTTGNTPGFYHYTVQGSDGAGVVQTQGGWIVVGNPAASLSKTGDNQSGPRGGQLALSVTLNPASSGGTNTGASIYFTTDSGVLSSPIVATDSSGNAGVMLTLPSTAGTVHVTAQGPYGLGNPVATFTETSQ